VTYNFDPDRWLADRLELLQLRRAAGELDETAYLAARAALERRYEELVARLDGTYRIPDVSE